MVIEAKRVGRQETCFYRGSHNLYITVLGTKMRIAEVVSPQGRDGAEIQLLPVYAMMTEPSLYIPQKEGTRTTTYDRAEAYYLEYTKKFWSGAIQLASSWILRLDW